MAKPDWRRPVSGRWRQAAIAVALGICTSTVSGQDVTEPSLKAAFIYNFAKFTGWPGGVLSPGSPFAACVLGDDRISEALERAVRGRLLDGHTIRVSKVTPDGTLRSCHLLYISGLPAAQAGPIVTGLRNLPVLTISDLDEFLPMGGIARIFVENGKMRFDLNFGLAKRSRLELSSKLLSLASTVRDEPNGAGR
jgi:hypothetical protein